MSKYNCNSIKNIRDKITINKETNKLIVKKLAILNSIQNLLDSDGYLKVDVAEKDGVVTVDLSRLENVKKQYSNFISYVNSINSSSILHTQSAISEMEAIKKSEIDQAEKANASIDIQKLKDDANKLTQKQKDEWNSNGIFVSVLGLSILALSIAVPPAIFLLAGGSVPFAVGTALIGFTKGGLIIGSAVTGAGGATYVSAQFITTSSESERKSQIINISSTLLRAQAENIAQNEILNKRLNFLLGYCNASTATCPTNNTEITKSLLTNPEFFGSDDFLANNRYLNYPAGAPFSRPVSSLDQKIIDWTAETYALNREKTKFDAAYTALDTTFNSLGGRLNAISQILTVIDDPIDYNKTTLEKSEQMWNTAFNTVRNLAKAMSNPLANFEPNTQFPYVNQGIKNISQGIQNFVDQYDFDKLKNNIKRIECMYYKNAVTCFFTDGLPGLDNGQRQYPSPDFENKFETPIKQIVGRIRQNANGDRNPKIDLRVLTIDFVEQYKKKLKYYMDETKKVIEKCNTYLGNINDQLIQLDIDIVSKQLENLENWETYLRAEIQKHIDQLKTNTKFGTAELKAIAKASVGLVNAGAPLYKTVRVLPQDVNINDLCSVTIDSNGTNITVAIKDVEAGKKMIENNKRPIAGGLSIDPQPSEFKSTGYSFITQNQVNYKNVHTIKGWDPGSYSYQITLSGEYGAKAPSDEIKDLVAHNIGDLEFSACFQ